MITTSTANQENSGEKLPTTPSRSIKAGTPGSGDGGKVIFIELYFCTFILLR